MPRFDLVTVVPASPASVFAACLDVDAHTRSMGASGERAVAGITNGRLGPGQTVTWQARHFGVRWRMTVQITEYESPHRFVDEQVSGPFRRWRHEHVLTSDPDDPATTVMRDVVDFTAPAGLAGSLIGVVILRPYLRRLIGRRNCFLAHSLAG
ncbi:SRPBCC family protein [Micromonospora sp. NPDC005172]|uniref:SRPBCC family protein n=1 Tax=Micromonospora sp. NPDC005172 TaxID=3156867 RepID=UPI0033B0CBA1